MKKTIEIDVIDFSKLSEEQKISKAFELSGRMMSMTKEFESTENLTELIILFANLREMLNDKEKEQPVKKENKFQRKMREMMEQATMQKKAKLN